MREGIIICWPTVRLLGAFALSALAASCESKGPSRTKVRSYAAKAGKPSNQERPSLQSDVENVVIRPERRTLRFELDVDDALPVLQAALGVQDERTRWKIIMYFDRYRGHKLADSAIEILYEHYAREELPSCRFEILAAMVRLDSKDKRTLDVLERACRDANQRLREMAFDIRKYVETGDMRYLERFEQH